MNIIEFATEKRVETIVLLAFIAFSLYLGPANLLNDKIVHDFPYSYFASDAFSHLAFLDSVKYNGNFYVYAAFVSAGYPDVVASDPPIKNTVSAILSYVTGFETYDIAYLILFIIEMVSALVFYLIIRDFNKSVAVLSLPLALFVFTGNFVTMFTWGNWTTVYGTIFLITFFWLLNKDLPKKVYLIALALSFAFLSKPPEFFFGVLFLIIYLGLSFLLKRFSVKDIKFWLGCFALVFIIAWYYWIITFLIIFPSAGETQFSKFITLPTWADTGLIVPLFTDFGWVMYLVLGGFLISLFVIKKEKNTAFLVGLFMFLVGFVNYVGLGKRAFQTRFHWPIYLSVFLGICLYKLFVTVLKKNTYQIFALVSIVLMAFFSYQYYAEFPRSDEVSGLMDKYHWQGLMWVRNNTEQNSTVLYLYGDPYQQGGTLFSAYRKMYRMDIDNNGDYVRTFQNNTIKRFYKTNAMYEGVYGMPYRTSFFDFKHHYDDPDQSLTAYKERDICQFDYIVADKTGRAQALAQYNLFLANKLLETGLMQKVFENEIVAILKNNGLKDKCSVFEEKIAQLNQQMNSTQNG